MRMSIARAALYATGLALIAGCVYKPSPVLMQGRAEDIAALAGTWQGEYFSHHSGRTGIITLEIRPGKDTAFGEVVMEGSPGQPVLAEDARWGGHAAHARAPEILTIAFVSVRRGTVQGALEPYEAPDCKCVVRTTFTGAISGDIISGDFLTTGETWLRQTGKWSVRRTKVASRQLEQGEEL